VRALSAFGRFIVITPLSPTCENKTSSSDSADDNDDDNDDNGAYNRDNITAVAHSQLEINCCMSTY